MSAAMVTCWTAVLVASFVKQDRTHNDFERFEDLRLLTAFFVLFIASCGLYLVVYARRPAVSTRLRAAVTLVSAALLLASFPVGSKDLFAYSFLGRIWGHYRVNPFNVPPETFHNDPWYASLSGKPFSVYGPVFLWQTRVVDTLAGDSLWSAVWLYKAWATATLLVCLWLANALLSRTAPRPSSALVLLLMWNPLILFESAGSGHNDLAMLLLLLGAFWCWQRGRAESALALLVVSFWYKWYSVVFIPLFLLDTLETGGPAKAFRQAAFCAVALVVVGLISLAPLPGSATTILTEWLHPQKMSGIYPNELPPPLAALFWSLWALGLFDTDVGFQIFQWTRFVIFGLLVCAIALRQWRATPGMASLAQGCFLIGLASFMLLITQLWPWHLLTVVVLGFLSAEEPYVFTAVLLTVLGMLSYFLTFAVATLLLLLIGAALWLLRRLTGAPTDLRATLARP